MFDKIQTMQETRAAQSGYPSKISYRDQINNNLINLKQQVLKYERILKLLDANPVIEEFMDLSQM